MSHEELRDLLRRVVPEAPEPLPGSLVAAGRRSRRRRRAVVVGVAAVAVVVVATTAVVLGGSEPTPRPDTVASPSPEPKPTTPPATTAPYDANVCPETIPASFDNPRAIDVADVVAITYCSTLLDGPGPATPLTPEAFVGSPQAFVASVPANAMPRRACLLMSFRPPGAVVFRMADGRSVAVAADCESVRLGGVRVLAQELSTVFQAALDAQRDRLEYDTRVELATCDDPAAAGPVRPGREGVVAAVYCNGDDVRRAPLDAMQLLALRAAWEAAAPIPESEVTDCYYAGDTGAYLRATTERGDTVALAVSACGYLVLASPTIEPLRIGVTPADLGQG